MSTNFDSSTPLAYTGLNTIVNPPTIAVNRAPLTTDWQSFNPGDFWRDTSVTPPVTYLLESVSGNVAIWQALVTGGSNGILTINTISPSGSGDFGITAGSNITITPGTNSISIATTTPGGVSSVTGTAGQITATPTTGAVVVGIDATYAGQSSINTVGTINSGTWNGSVIAGQYGGTGIANTGQTINLGSPVLGYVLTSDGSGNATWQPGASGGFTQVVRQVFTSSGTYTPTAGMVYCDVEIIGGGGGGGGAAAALNKISAGGGGGSGGYSKSVFSALTIGASQVVTIGAGGTAGLGSLPGNFGGTGGVSSFGAILTANGGTGGTNSNIETGNESYGGSGGTSSGGTININGNQGSDGFGFYSSSTSYFVVSGMGGSSFYGSGAENLASNGSVSTASAAGTSGFNYGSGGGGALTANSTIAVDGGVGSPGLCVITEYCAVIPLNLALPWNDINSAGVTMAENNGYNADFGTLCTLTLPAVAAYGSLFWVVGKNVGGWLIAQNAGQTIHMNNAVSTTGITGSLASTLSTDGVLLQCSTANTDFTVISTQGILTLT